MEERVRYHIPIARPRFSGEEIELISDALRSGWISQGPRVREFEERLAHFCGAKFAVATTSCTTAMHIAMLAHGIGPGDDVICPSYSFIATANCIKHAGAEPQFADIDPHSLNLCPKAVEALIEGNYTGDLKNRKSGNRLKSILVVHQVGIPADLDAFKAIAGEHGLILIEDSACALGSTYKGRPIGSSDNTGALSFHPRKVITCGEGGMLLTDDSKIAEKARTLREHGASISPSARHGIASTVYESYEIVGYNYRMTDVQAIIGLKQMDLMDTFLRQRAAIATVYNRAFREIDELEVIDPPDYVTGWNYQSYPIRLKDGRGLKRDVIMAELDKRGIASRRGIPPIHKEPVYDKRLCLPSTESVSRRSLFLPIFPGLSNDEVDYVISAVRQALLEKVASG